MNRGGQVIVLTVMILGGTLLGAASIAGLLMLYQIRQATDLGNSGKAIFAADAGIEWALYEHFHPGNNMLFQANRGTPPDARYTAEFSNGARGQVSCYKGTNEVSCANPEIDSIKSIGSSGNTSRAFRLSF